MGSNFYPKYYKFSHNWKLTWLLENFGISKVYPSEHHYFIGAIYNLFIIYIYYSISSQNIEFVSSYKAC